MYLGVRNLGTLFLRSSSHFLFKNISHHGYFQGFSARELCGANKWVGIGLDGNLCVGPLFEHHFAVLIRLFFSEKVEKDGEEKEFDQNTVFILRHLISAGCVIQEKTDYIGHDINNFQNVENYFGCAKKAAENQKAKFWTYVASTKECWIKTSNKEKKEASVAHVSGNVECGQKEGDWLRHTGNEVMR